MARSAAQLAAFGSVAVIAACNAITGIGALEEDLSVDAGVDAPAAVIAAPKPTPTTTPTTTTTTELPPPSPPEAGADADAAFDASTDQATLPPVCRPATIGPKYGSLAVATQTGVPFWGDETGARAPGDDMQAHTNGGGDGKSNPNMLTVGQYGFTVPSGATIKGIKLDIARTANGNVLDKAVTLFKGAAKNNGKWPDGPFNGPFVTTSYGGPTDLWGTTWTAEDVNAPGFSANLTTEGDGDGHIDAMGLTVYYCLEKAAQP